MLVLAGTSGMEQQDFRIGGRSRGMVSALAIRVGKYWREELSPRPKSRQPGGACWDAGGSGCCEQFFFDFFLYSAYCEVSNGPEIALEVEQTTQEQEEDPAMRYGDVLDRDQYLVELESCRVRRRHKSGHLRILNKFVNSVYRSKDLHDNQLRRYRTQELILTTLSNSHA